MDRRKLYLLVVLLLLFVSMEASFVLGDGKGGNGNGGQKGNGDNKDGNQGNNNNDGNQGGNGKGKGEGDNGNKGDNGNQGNNNNGNQGDSGKGNGKRDGDEENYKLEPPNEKTGQERATCQAEGYRCHLKTLECPAQCTERKPKKNKKNKGCFIDCRKCETTCKIRKPNCDGYGSVCYDPRFVGGDGVMFYFHGAKGADFALVSDDELQINGHFIGRRPVGRTRDFTWVQALSVMFDVHTLVIAAKRVSHWDNNADSLIVRWNGDTVDVPIDGEAEWLTKAGKRVVVVERTDDTNSVRVIVTGLVEIHVKVTPIGEQENRVHNYQLPADDAFAHLETQFSFPNLTDLVEGVLGKTYRPDYVTPVKIGVPMPLMGGEDKYRTPSLLSPLCKACRFSKLRAMVDMVAQY